MSCSICEKRPPKRFCPAKGEKICAVCCGKEREVSIDCPSGCPHLIAARRYEAENRKPVPPEEFPYSEIEVPVDFIYGRWSVIAGIAASILAFQVQNREINDGIARTALEALAETYRTLETGIYYERPPELSLSRALYANIAEFFQEFRKQEAGRTGVQSLKDSDILRLLVFLLRVMKQETNGRPRSRAFLDFLGAKFPLAESAAPEGSRIIMP